MDAEDHFNWTMAPPCGQGGNQLPVNPSQHLKQAFTVSWLMVYGISLLCLSFKEDAIVVVRLLKTYPALSLLKSHLMK